MRFSNDLPYRYLMEYFKQLVDFWLIYAIFWGVNQYKANKNREIQGLHMQQELVKAQLSSLQMQLHPHFFFNTLNAISSIMYTDPARADRIISRLGGFLRTVLQLTDTPSHSLSDEIALTKQFTQIMEERYPDKLTVTYNIPQKPRAFPSPGSPASTPRRKCDPVQCRLHDSHACRYFCPTGRD